VQTADKGKDGGDAVQTVTGDRPAKQAGGEDVLTYTITGVVALKTSSKREPTVSVKAPMMRADPGSVLLMSRAARGVTSPIQGRF
jgi:hypothetical protein